MVPEMVFGSNPNGSAKVKDTDMLNLIAFVFMIGNLIAAVSLDTKGDKKAGIHWIVFAILGLLLLW